MRTPMAWRAGAARITALGPTRWDDSDTNLVRKLGATANIFATVGTTPRLPGIKAAQPSKRKRW